MTLQAVAGFLGQVGLQHPAKLYRNMNAGLAGRRTGAFRYGDFALTPSGSGMSLTIGAGDAVLMGTETATDQGGYYVYNNANEVLAWPASTSLPRVDSLILRVIDTDYGSDPATSKATWEVVSGTPAASPTAVADSAFAPAGSYYHPGAWWRVADFTVPASSTNLAAATLSHKQKYARIGGHTICLNSDKPSDARLGDTATLIDVTGSGQWVYYTGSAWTDVTSLTDLALYTGKPLVRLIQQSAQAVTNGSPTALQFGSGSEDIDTHNYHDVTTNNTRVTPTKAGIYRVTVTVVMVAATYVQVVSSVAKNGTRIEGQLPLRPDAASGAASGSISTGMVQLNGTTDYVEGYVTFSASGNSTTNSAAGFRCVMEVEYLRPLP